MALNGSNFGAASSLEEYDEKHQDMYPNSPPGYADAEHDDYTSVPPAVQLQQTPSNGGAGVTYDSETDDMHMTGGHAVTYGYRRE